jgi:hypothetical protein
MLTEEIGYNIFVEEENLAEAKREIYRTFDKKLKFLTAQYSEQEQKTWGRQLEEAQRLLADNSTATPMLDAILTGEPTGTTREQISTRIVAKARALEVASGQLLAEKNRAIRELDETS